MKGLELELERGERRDVPPLLLLAPRLTGDPRYLAPFRAALASPNASASTLQNLSRWLQGVKTEEAKELFAEVRERIRSAGRVQEEEE